MLAFGSMLNRQIILLTIISLLANTLLAQKFVGEILYRDHYEYVKLDCKDQRCQFSIPYLDGDETFGVRSESLFADNWEVQRGSEIWKFETKRDGHHITGKLITPRGIQTISLREQLSALSKKEMEKYAGVFDDGLGNRAIVYIENDYLHMMSPFSEKTMSMKPVETDIFWSASGELWQYSNFQLGVYDTLLLRDRFDNTRTLRRVPPYTEEELYIPIGNDTLFAKLFLPPSVNKVPACLILPGGGTVGMANYEFEARFLVGYGIASLVFDKPGNGKSKGTGNFRNQTFEEKNEQYKLLFKYLQNHPKVDTKRVGVHGPSEGGRLALMMAMDMDEVAFVNATAGPIMTMKEGQLYAITNYHRNMNLSEVDILGIRNVWNDYYNNIIDGVVSTSVIDKANEFRAQNAQLFLPPNYTGLPSSPNKSDLLNNRVLTGLSTIKCPVFLQYGENDQRVNAHRSVQNFKTNFSGTAKIVIYPRGNHSFMTPQYEICQGYATDKIYWLKQIGIL